MQPDAAAPDNAAVLAASDVPAGSILAAATAAAAAAASIPTAAPVPAAASVPTATPVIRAAPGAAAVSASAALAASDAASDAADACSATTAAAVRRPVPPPRTLRASLSATAHPRSLSSDASSVSTNRTATPPTASVTGSAAASTPTSNHQPASSSATAATSPATPYVAPRPRQTGGILKMPSSPASARASPSVAAASFARRGSADSPRAGGIMPRAADPRPTNPYGVAASTGAAAASSPSDPTAAGRSSPPPLPSSLASTIAVAAADPSPPVSFNVTLAQLQLHPGAKCDKHERLVNLSDRARQAAPASYLTPSPALLASVMRGTTDSGGGSSGAGSGTAKTTTRLKWIPHIVVLVDTTLYVFEPTGENPAQHHPAAALALGPGCSISVSRDFSATPVAVPSSEDDSDAASVLPVVVTISYHRSSRARDPAWRPGRPEDDVEWDIRLSAARGEQHMEDWVEAIRTAIVEAKSKATRAAVDRAN
ncbi:hypothetical protein HK405_001375, partial [Cladochytrium tenue]